MGIFPLSRASLPTVARSRGCLSSPYFLRIEHFFAKGNFPLVRASPTHSLKRLQGADVLEVLLRLLPGRAHQGGRHRPLKELHLWVPPPWCVCPLASYDDVLAQG